MNKQNNSQINNHNNTHWIDVEQKIVQTVTQNAKMSDYSGSEEPLDVQKIIKQIAIQASRGDNVNQITNQIWTLINNSKSDFAI